MERGLLISKGGFIVKNNENSFTVHSQTFANKQYLVEVLESIWVCNCPDFEYRKIEYCKHIYGVKLWLENQPKIFADDAIKCDQCGSIRVMKYGTYKEKQVYKCKDCQHMFKESSLLKGLKFDPEIITFALDLYFSGLSLRKVARNLNDHFELDLSFSTVYSWIQKYIPRISENVNSLIPQLSNQWHVDELFVKMKGGETRKGQSGISYLWNIMDRESRFLIASKLSEKRDINGAIQAFNEAIKNSQVTSLKLSILMR
jgi:transposase-like protein